MEVGLAVGEALACGPLPLCFRACNYHLPWSVSLRNSMCGQGCGQGARPASRRSHGHCLVGLMADIPGTFPSPGAATGPHRVGVGGQSLQAGQTSQPPRLGCLATNFLLGSLRPRGLQVLSFCLHCHHHCSCTREPQSRPWRNSLRTLSQRGSLKPRIGPRHSLAESDPQCSENQSSSSSLGSQALHHLTSSPTPPPHSLFQPGWPLLRWCCLRAFALAVPSAWHTFPSGAHRAPSLPPQEPPACEDL